MAETSRTPDEPARPLSGGVVYVIGWQPSGPLKIGYTMTPVARLAALQVGSPFLLRIYAGFVFDRAESAARIETAAHAALESQRLSGEWFKVDVRQCKAAVLIQCAQLGIEEPRPWRPTVTQAERRAGYLGTMPDLSRAMPDPPKVDHGTLSLAALMRRPR